MLPSNYNHNDLIGTQGNLLDTDPLLYPQIETEKQIIKTVYY